MARPLNIYLVRHGESEANADKTTYARTPDWQIGLTDAGRAQARQAGDHLFHLLQDARKRYGHDSVGAYVSPYRRTVQTWDEIAPWLTNVRVSFVKQDPRLIEQRRGNPADREKLSADYKATERERRELGTFFYGFHNGESGDQVWSRINSFEETRDLHAARRDNPDSVIIVGHSFTMRVHLMHLTGLDIDGFHKLRDPKNAEIIHLTLDDGDRFGNAIYRRV